MTTRARARQLTRPPLFVGETLGGSIPDPPDRLDRPDDPSPNVLSEATIHLIGDLMRRQRVTQKQLAAELGVTETTVSRWLHRKTGLPLSLLGRIASRLGTTIGQLLDADPLAERLRQALTAPTAPAEPAAPSPPSATETWVRTEVAALRASFQALQQSLHLVPSYQWGVAGDPRGATEGEDEPTPSGAEYVPAGRVALVGRRGFAVRVQGESMAGRGIRDGDVCFVNPDKNYRLGSAVLARVDGHMVIKEVALGPDGRDLLRSNPLSGAPELVPGRQFNVIGPVVLVCSVSVLHDGLGNAGDPEGSPTGPAPLPYAGSSWASKSSTQRATPTPPPTPQEP